MRKCGKILHSQTGHRWHYVCALHAGYQRLQIHSEYVILIASTRNNVCMNLAQFYIIRTLPVLLRNYQVLPLSHKWCTKWPGETYKASKTNLGKAMMIWCTEQCPWNMKIRGVETKSGITTMTKHTKIQFKASDSWLWQFSKNYGNAKRDSFSAALSVPTK